MKIRDLYDIKIQTGEIGIEIELEGSSFPTKLEKYWQAKPDGSLRGVSIEYILTKPLSRSTYAKALKYLTNEQEERGTTLKNTGNAGIHIHINVQEMSMVQVYNFICLYLIYEDILMSFCGESREGNFFCLRSKDAEYLLKVLIESAKEEHWGNFRGGNLRYASINVGALSKFGSLEFRGMRSPTDNDTIILWVETLLKLKDAAKRYKTPKHVIEAFSIEGQEYFTKNIFGIFSKKIFKDYNWGEQLIEGMWRAQDVAYCRDWETLLNKKTSKKVKKKTSGFGFDTNDSYLETANIDPARFVTTEDMTIRPMEEPRVQEPDIDRLRQLREEMSREVMQRVIGNTRRRARVGITRNRNRDIGE